MAMSDDDERTTEAEAAAIQQIVDAAMEHLAKVDGDKTNEWFMGFIDCIAWVRDHLASQTEGGASADR